jgi:hypothetical protein
MEEQLDTLRARMARGDIDAAEIAERAETLLTYAKCLRDFPELPGVLQTKYPEPPASFRAAIDETAA